MDKSNKNSIVGVSIALVFVCLVAVLVFSGKGSTVPAKSLSSAAIAADLSSADSFAVLASTYTNTVAGSTIGGDVGYTTPPAVAPTINGSTHMADGSYSAAGTSQNNALSALNAQTCDFSFGSTTDLSLLPQPLVPGVYCITGAASIGTGGISLSGSEAYLFRISGALTTVANSIVSVSSSCNVFWTPTGATTLGANSTFAGTVIDPAGITVGSTVSWSGRALAFGGTVTTDADTITAPSCTVAATPPPAVPSALATLHIIKQVINNNGGTATASNFNLHVKLSGTDVTGSPAAGTVAPGTSYTLSADTYVVSEDTTSLAYTQSFSGDCSGTGSITLSSGDDVTCTIINDDIAPGVVTPIPTPTIVYPLPQTGFPPKE